MLEKNDIYLGYLNSPLGILEIAGRSEGIVSIGFDAQMPNVPSIPNCLQEVIRQLEEYFKGTRKKFEIPLLLEGTDFQKRVWSELTQISHGRTVSYRDIATSLGKKNAVRAVGNANAKNPIPIIVPCHRVIGSNGKLAGYAGGLWRKKWLLQHEGVVI